MSMPPNEQYMLTQQPYYPPSATPNNGHEFYSPPQSVHMSSVPMHDGAPIVSQNIPVSSPMSIPHAPPPPPQQQQHPQPTHPPPHPQHQHQYLHMMQQQQQQQQQQQRYDPTPRTSYLPQEYQQPPFPGHHMPEGQSMMVSYHPNFQYKPPARILNQPEGTDWGFLGVG